MPSANANAPKINGTLNASKIKDLTKGSFTANTNYTPVNKELYKSLAEKAAALSIEGPALDKIVALAASAPSVNTKEKPSNADVVANVKGTTKAVNVTAVGKVSAVKADAAKALTGFGDDLTVYVAAPAAGGRRTRRRAKRSKRTRRHR